MRTALYFWSRDKSGWLDGMACMYACALYAIKIEIPSITEIQTPGRGIRSIYEGWIDECMHACRLFIEWVQSGFGSLFGLYFVLRSLPVSRLGRLTFCGKFLRNCPLLVHKFQISLATAGL